MANEVSISHILGTSWSGDLDLDTGSNNFASSIRGPGGSLENVTLVNPTSSMITSYLFLEHFQSTFRAVSEHF